MINIHHILKKCLIHIMVILDKKNNNKFMKIEKTGNTSNGNGFYIWWLTFKWKNEFKRIRIWRKIVGDGRSGDTYVGC